MRPVCLHSFGFPALGLSSLRRHRLLRRCAFLLAALMFLPALLPTAAVAQQTATQHQSVVSGLALSASERLADTPYLAPAHTPAPPAAPASGAVPQFLRTQAPSSPTLLDEVGLLAHPVPAATVDGWVTELKDANVAPERAALLHLWLGEWQLAHSQQPKTASQHFWHAQQWAHKDAPLPGHALVAKRLYGLAAFDRATALFYAGAYQPSSEAFLRLLTLKTRLPGYDLKSCALWYRHALACANYHAERAAMGIPEPPQLDPECGVAALAACLRGLSLPYDRQRLLSVSHVTGEGNDLTDILQAAGKLGVSARSVTADDQGLVALPKPLVAYVERDHFIAVVKADKAGVSYLCSDCGPWPGGQVDLTWKQWHALNPGVYGVVCKKGGSWDRALAASLVESTPSLRVAGNGSLHGLLSGRFSVHIPQSFLHQHIRDYDPGTYITCGGRYFSPICSDFIFCPTDSDGPGGGPGGGGPGGGCGGGGGPGGGGSGSGTGNKKGMAQGAGPSAGDPVNLATGGEEYRPAPDITVYNPHGPSVVWQRMYNSFRSNLQFTPGFGADWSHSYAASVEDGNSGTYYYSLVSPDGSKIYFNVPTVPSTSQPRVACTVQPGAPCLIECDYTGGNYQGSATNSFLVTWPDRTRWRIGQAKFFAPGYAINAPELLSQIIDRNGNSITLNYSSYDGNPLHLCPVSITDTSTSTPATLLSMQYAQDTNGIPYLVSVTDEPSQRSVYYHQGPYADAALATTPMLDGVSQVVATGTTNAVTAFNRYTYGYTLVPNPEPGNSYSVAFLHTITVPSPKNDGTTSTATINYATDTTMVVTSISDGNGYTHVYTPVSGSNKTTVTMKDASGNTVYTRTASFDSSMSETGMTDGSNNPVYTVNGFSGSNPYRPSSTTDGNSKTTASTWDIYGNLLTQTSPRGTVTTYHYDYSVFPLGELQWVQEGSKTKTQYTYDDSDGYTDSVTGAFNPCGLLASLSTPKPGSASGSGSQVTTSYIYDVTGQATKLMGALGLGNLLSVTMPGNNATLVGGVDQGITVSFSYTTDGSYTQAAAIGQPVAVMDNLGNVTHLRYDTRGNCLSVKDALGYQTDSTYNIANQTLTTTYPATNQSGAGRASIQDLYQYPGGPLSAAVAYDESSSGNPIRQTNYAYGKEGETLSVTGSTEPVWYAYDALYRLKTLANNSALSPATSYSYNTAGYLANIRYPGYNSAVSTTRDRVQFPTYDSNGNLTKRIDGNNVETDYVYNDDENLLTDITYPATPALNVHYHYDAYGRRDQMTDSVSGLFNVNGTVNTVGVTTTYDDNDSPLSVATKYHQVGGTTLLQTRTLSYDYYPDGSRKTLTLPGLTIALPGSTTNPSTVFAYSYDGDGRQTSLTNPLNETSKWTYYANNWLNTQILNYQNASSYASKTTYSYDQRGEVTDLKTTNASSAVLNEFTALASAHSYDGVGNRVAQAATVNSDPFSAHYSGTTTYGYDAGQTADPTLRRGQLTSEAFTAGSGGTSFSNTMAYDQTSSGGASNLAGPGNPTTFRGSYTTFNADNQNTAYTVDGDGNPTTYGTKTLGYDAENRLTSYNTTTLTCGYTGDGLRAWKRSGSGTPNFYLYDGPLPVCEIDGSDTTAVSAKRLNTWGANGLASRITQLSTSSFYTFDMQGNLAQRLNPSGTVAVSYQTDAFGKVTSSDGGVATYAFGAQWGYSQDSETGFVLCTHRFYDPQTGRWLTRDPIDYDGGINLYGYVQNDPVNGVDPNGTGPIPPTTPGGPGNPFPDPGGAPIHPTPTPKPPSGSPSVPVPAPAPPGTTAGPGGVNVPIPGNGGSVNIPVMGSPTPIYTLPPINLPIGGRGGTGTVGPLPVTYPIQSPPLTLNFPFGPKGGPGNGNIGVTMGPGQVPKYKCDYTIKF